MRYKWFDYIRLVIDTLFSSRYERHLVEEVNRLEAEKQVMAAKLAKLEVSVFSVASPAGAEYAKAVNPPSPPIGGIGASGVLSWAAQQAEHQKYLEELEHDRSLSAEESLRQAEQGTQRTQ